MAISFSGLASGLDTASWVTSLTQLRQAKVTKLEEQKQGIIAAQSTLQGIRSFFSSFRASLEKITDSKFKVSSMDIFSKKIAEVSNAAILSATAKSNAAEGSYEVKVNNIATQTQAKSGYRYKTTIISTTQASTTSYLKNVGVGYGTNPSDGVTPGNIEITHNGVTSTIEIGANETMSSFLDKLHNVGINAEFDNSTGIFSIDVNVGDINDVGNTNILNKLKISNINYGYTGNQLKIEETHEEYHQATNDTLLSELGVHAGTLTLTASDGVYEVTLANDETIGSLVSSLREAGINATFNDGVFSIDNAYISNDGTTHLIEKFGFNTDNISSQTQESCGLTYQTVYTETTTAKLTTLLKDINGVTLEGNQTIAVEDESGGLHTINVGTTTTIGDMVNAMNAPGINLGASFNETTGILSINNGWIVTGGTFDVEAAFGLVYTGEDAVVTGSSLTVSTTTVTGATDSTKLKDLSTAVTNGTIKVTDTLGVVHNVAINNESTIGSFVSTIRGLGLGAEFDNTTGVLTLTGGSYTTDGVPSGNASNILEVFYGTNTLTPSAIDSATSTSSALYQTVTTTAAATGTTQLSQLNGSGSTGTHTHTFNVNGNTVSFNIADNATINQLVSTMRSNGIDASFDPSTSTISMRGAQYVSSTAGFDLGSIMNFTETVTGRYVTSNSVMAQNVTTGNTMTSASQVNYTIETTTTTTMDVTGTVATSVTSSLTYNVTTQGSTTTTTTGMTATSDTMLISTTSGITQTSGSMYTDGTTTGITATTGTMSVDTTSGVTQTSGTMYTDGTTTGITATTDTMTINTTSGVTQTSGAMYTNGTTTGITATSDTMTIETTSGITQTSGTMYTDGTTSGITQTTGTMYTVTTSATSQTSGVLYADTTTPVNTTSGVLTYETTTFNPGATTTSGITITSETLYIPGSTTGITQTLGAIGYDRVGAGTTTGISGTQTSTPAYTITAEEVSETTGITTTLQSGVLTYESVTGSGTTTTTVNGTSTTYVQGVRGETISDSVFHYDSKPQTVTITATSTTTMAQLGYTGNAKGTAALIYVKNGSSTCATVTVLTTDTVAQYTQKLQNAGVDASYTNIGGGKLRLKIDVSTNIDNYIESILTIGNTNELIFRAGLNISYTRSTEEVERDESTPLPYSQSGNVGSAGYYYITTKGGSTYTLGDAETGTTIGDFLDILRGLGYSAGITDGQVWFTPGANMNSNNAIVAVTSSGSTDLLDWLGLPTTLGAGVTYTTGYSNTSVNKYSKVFTLCADTTETHSLNQSLASIYGYANNTTIIVENTSGQKITCNASSTTLGSFIQQMNNTLGLDFYVTGDNGVAINNYSSTTQYKTIKISCSGGGSNTNWDTKALKAIYTTGASGDPDAPPIDVSQVGYGKTYIRYQKSYHINGGTQTTTTVTATGSTTLSQLGLQPQLYGYNIITDTGTITVNSDTTLNQFITALGTAGITATLATSGTNKGKLTINNTESHYIISLGGLENIFSINVGEGETFNVELGDAMSTTTTITATASTTLDELIWGPVGAVVGGRGGAVGGGRGGAVVGGRGGAVGGEYEMVCYNTNKGIYETYTISGTTTLGDINNFGPGLFSFNSSFTGHTLEFTGYNSTEGAIVTYIDPELANALGIQVGNGYTYTVSGGTTTTVAATASDMLETFGSRGGTITLSNTEVGIFYADSTYQDILDFFDDNGITASFTNGVFSVGSPSDSNYIASGYLPLSNFEGSEILSGEDISYEITAHTLAAGTAAINSLEGWGFGNDDITIATDSTTITVASSSTINQLVGAINSIGNNDFTASYSNGTFTITPSEGHYITDISSNLLSVLRLEVGEGNSYQTAAGAATGETITHTASGTTTMYQLGMHSQGTIELSNGSIITVETSDTISDLQDYLDDYNITNSFAGGMIDIGDPDDDIYITNMSSNLAAALGIEVGQGHTYNITQNGTVITSSNTLSELGLNTSANIVNNANQTITVTGADSIEDLIDALDGIGITAAINIDGTFTLGDTGDSNYITSIDAALQVALGLTAGAGHSYTTGTGTASASATLAQLGMSGDSARIIIYGGVDNEFYTINLSSSNTLADVIDWIESYDISASLSNGQITFTPGDDYIYSMSGNLETLFGIYAGQGDSYNANGSATATSSTTLGALGITGTKYIVTSSNTITLNSGSTLQNVIDGLGSAGISATLANGVMTFTPSAGHYIESMSGGLEVLFDIETGVGQSYSLNSVTASESTTLGQLGMAGSSAYIVTDSGTLYFNSNTELGSIMQDLHSYGIEAELVNGQMVFTPDGDYIQSISSNLEAVLGIYAGQGSTYGSNGSATATTATTLGALGITGTKYITTSDNTITLTSTSTLQNVIDGLGSASITATLANGVMTFTPSAGHYIESMSGGLEVLFNVETGQGQSFNVNSVTASTSSTLAQLGMTGNNARIVTDSGALDFGSNTTLGEIISDLADVGITASLSNGTLTFTPGAGHYIQSMSSNLESLLSMYAGEGDTYNTSGSATASAATTLGALGLTGTKYIVTSDNTITLTSTSTLQNVIDGLGSASITATLANGVMTFTPSAGHYIESMSGGLEVLFDVETGQGQSFNVNSITASTSSTLAQLGMSGDNARIITDTGTINLTATSTLQNLQDQLATHGITAALSNGALTFTPGAGHYIQSMSSNLESLLSMYAGEGDTYNTSGSVTASAATTLGALGLTGTKYIVTSDNTITLTSTSTLQNVIDGLGSASITATLANGVMTFTPSAGHYIESMSAGLETIFDIETGQNSSFSINSVTATLASTLADIGMRGSSGHIITDSGTLNFTSNSTLQDVVDSLSDAGITAILNNGVMTFAPSEGHYIYSVSNYLASALGMDSGYGSTYGTTVNSTAGSTVTYTATSATTLNTLGMLENGIIVTNNGNINVSINDSIGTLITKLGNANITASLNESTGIFTLGNVSDTNYVTAMSPQLAQALGNIVVGLNASYQFATTGQSTTTNTVTTTQTVTGSNTFSDIGVTSQQIITLSNGNSVTINPGTTISSFLSDISGKGINASLQNGIFHFEPQNGVYITNDSGDTILEALHIIGSEISVSQLNLGQTKLKDLRDSSGNALNITSGAIRAYKNGIQYNIAIDNNTTLEDLATQLRNYNIEMSYSAGSEGAITFSGTGNSYLAEVSGGTNLLTKLGATSWNSTVDSVSQSLAVETPHQDAIDGNTKITAIVNSTGGSIGLSTGKYKIVAGGINYEGSIGANTTVNDFFNQLSLYGISGSINSDGQITLSTTNDDTYLVRANGASGYSNIVDTLFPSWTFGNIYVSDSMDVTNITTNDITSETRLKDIDQGTYIPGKFVVSRRDEADQIINLAEDATVGDFMAAISYHGFTSYIEGGKVIIRNDGYATLNNYTDVPSQASNVLGLLGLNTAVWENPGHYLGTNQTTNNYDTVYEAATRNTKLSELRDSSGNSFGITTGEYYVYTDGVRHALNLTSTDITLESFMNTLESYGINTILDSSGSNSVLKLIGSGDSYIAPSTAPGASNVVTKLFGNSGPDTLYDYDAYLQTTELVSTTVIAGLGTFVSDYDHDPNKSEGIFAFSVDGNYSQISITAYETFGSLLEKFERAGVQASLENGILRLETGNKSFVLDTENTTSHLIDNLGLHFSDNLGGFAASTDAVTQTTTTIEDRTLSVAQYADDSTQISLLNISSGTFSVYRNGEKKVINIDNTETFSDLRGRLTAAFGGDINMTFENGKLVFYSNNENIDVQVGSSNDTSNMSSICGFSQDENGRILSARELYKVNASSVITTPNLFRYGNVTEGTFTIGDDTFTITSSTTIQNIIAQINSSEKANASAYWDSVDGKLVISARNTGASMVNIEAGTSNFTDILGLTTSEWNGDGSLKVTKIRLDSQEIGQNAKFSINGTNFQSASNVVTSDISRIQGLTLNLKSASMGDTITVTVGKDTEAVTEAVGEFVESYNELVENVDAELNAGGILKDQSTLKFIKQQIRNLLVNTFAGATTFRNLAALGISTSSGNTVGLDTSNAGIEYLYFDAEKFMEGYNKDADAVKNMLVGSDETPGILIQIENIVENALATGSGYFSTADKSYSDKITSINEKIKKANQAIEAYRARLESKFQSMDLLISQMQNQYNSFLSKTA